MLKIERKLVAWIDEHHMVLFIGIMTLLALLIRSFSLDLELSDAQQSLLPWFEAIKEDGGFAALETQVGDYPMMLRSKGHMLILSVHILC